MGPIGLLVIRRTLAYGRLTGLVSGLGAASADAIYGGIAAFGLSAISALLIDNAILLNLFGGGFLLYLGVKTLTAEPVAESAETVPVSRTGILGAYASTFLLTLTNPMTILTFIGIFAGIGAAEVARADAPLMVLGVFLGSALWWLALSSGIGLFRARLSQNLLRWVNRLSGGMIVLFALAILLSVF